MLSVTPTSAGCPRSKEFLLKPFLLSQSYIYVLYCSYTARADIVELHL